MKKWMPLLIGLTLLLTLVLAAGCAGATPTPTHTPDPTATPIPTPTLGPTASPTPPPSPIETPTPSPSGDLEEDPPEGWAAYQNEEYGFRFWYPERWEQYSPEGIDEEVEFFTGFRDSTMDDFQENFVVMVPPYGDMSLESLGELLKGALQSFGALESDRYTTVNGEVGYEWILNWPSEEGFTYAGQKQRFIVLDTTAGWYQLGCSALEEQYAAHADTCDMIINSFKVD